MSLPRLLILVFATCTLSCAQDSPSLGDVARQARKQKQSTQTNSAQASDGKNADSSKARRIITNEEIPEKPEPANHGSDAGASSESKLGTSKRSAEYWKTQIVRVKNAIAKLQKNIDGLSNSILFVDANYENHVLWNERQREKQQELEVMKSQLSEFQKLLEDMQEAARSQGYGSSVYDP